ncbi:MAG: hypothetical protein IKC75_02025 [Clostridia bacterium]|nr:hypothetical protein [Clostridia bacterium]
MMPTLINQGTLFFTPAFGQQQSLDTNITTTEVEVCYGLEVSHAATPTTFTVGNTIFYTVLLRNTCTGTLYNPFVTVDFTGGELTNVPGSAGAFLYAGTGVIAVPVTATQNSPITFVIDSAIPAGGFVYLTYSATVTSATANEIVSTAIGAANEGSPTGPTISDGGIAVITRTPLSIVKTAPETADVGQSISYQFTIANNSGDPITLDRLTDQLPLGFAFTVATLTVDGTPVSLVAGTDYTVTPEGFFTLEPTSTVMLPVGAIAVLTLNGVVTA